MIFQSENRGDENFLEKTWNYLKSFFEREPPSIRDTWEKIRPTSTENSSSDEQKRHENRGSRKNGKKLKVSV